MLKLNRVCWMAVLLAGSSAHGIVNSIDATVTASVQESSATAQGDSDFAFKDLNDTTGTLPLIAQAQLLNPASVNGALAISTFSDPAASTVPNPLEFAFSIAASSESDALSRIASGSSSELREVNFLSSEIGAADGASLEVESQFFVDGLVMVWGAPGADLSDTTARIHLGVHQLAASASGTSSTDGSSEERLAAALTLGSSGGALSLQASGSLAPENVVVLDLTGRVPNLGPVYLLIIPNVAISYTYPAQVGDAFRLNASIWGEVHSQPGTGASIALGVPLVELASLLQSVAGPSGGAQLESALSDVLSNNPPVAAKPLVRKAVPTTVRIVDRADRVTLPTLPICGAAGVEMLLIPGMVFLACLTRRR
jgi:hypothetical protein